jgi:hypothetical protein
MNGDFELGGRSLFVDTITVFARVILRKNVSSGESVTRPRLESHISRIQVSSCANLLCNNNNKKKKKHYTIETYGEVKV